MHRAEVSENGQQQQCGMAAAGGGSCSGCRCPANNFGAGSVPQHRDTLVNIRRRYLVLVLAAQVSCCWAVEYAYSGDQGDITALLTQHSLPPSDLTYIHCVVFSVLLASVYVAELLFRITLFFDELKEPRFSDKYDASYCKCVFKVLGRMNCEKLSLRNHFVFLLIPPPAIYSFTYYGQCSAGPSAMINDHISLAFCVTPFIIISYMLVATFLPRISLAELRSVVNRNAQNVGYGLAYLYYYGYLRLLLPELKSVLYSDAELGGRCPLKRLFILIPDDGNCSLPWDPIRNTPSIFKARAGHRKRPYNNDVYEIKGGHYVLGFPRPVALMYSMCHEKGAGLMMGDLRTQIKLFYNTLVRLLADGSECYRRERIGTYVYKVPTYQIIHYAGSEDVQKVMERIRATVDFVDDLDDKTLPEHRHKKFDEERRHALDQPAPVENPHKTFPYMSSHTAQYATIVVTLVWILLVCVGYQQQTTLGVALVAVVLTTCTIACSHLLVWGTVVFAAEYWHVDYPACYKTVTQCFNKCYGFVTYYRGPKETSVDKSGKPVKWNSSRRKVVSAFCLACAIASFGALTAVVTVNGKLLLRTVSMFTMVSIASLVQHLFSTLVSDVEILREARKNALNVYKGLAWNYVIYLRDLLPGVTGTMNEAAIKKEDTFQGVHPRPLILFPTDAYCPKELGYPSRGSPLTYEKEVKVSTLVAGDLMGRTYNAAMYRVQHQDRTLRCLVEYPALLLTLYDMCRRGEIARDDLPYHVKLFYAEVKTLLAQNKVGTGTGTGSGEESCEACGKRARYTPCLQCRDEPRPTCYLCAVQQCTYCKLNSDAIAKMLGEVILDDECTGC